MVATSATRTTRSGNAGLVGRFHRFLTLSRFLARSCLATSSATRCPSWRTQLAAPAPETRRPERGRGGVKAVGKLGQGWRPRSRRARASRPCWAMSAGNAERFRNDGPRLWRSHRAAESVPEGPGPCGLKCVPDVFDGERCGGSGGPKVGSSDFKGGPARCRCSTA